MSEAIHLLSGMAAAAAFLLLGGLGMGAALVADALPALTGQRGRERSYLDTRGALL